jgi:hypothetical protein
MKWKEKKRNNGNKGGKPKRNLDRMAGHIIHQVCLRQFVIHLACPSYGNDPGGQLLDNL